MIWHNFIQKAFKRSKKALKLKSKGIYIVSQEIFFNFPPKPKYLVSFLYI